MGNEAMFLFGRNIVKYFVKENGQVNLFIKDVTEQVLETG